MQHCPPSPTTPIGSATLLAAALLAGAGAAGAVETLDWDASSTTPGATGGSGNWAATGATWWNTARVPPGNVTWINNAHARFGASAGTVNLKASLNAGSLAFTSAGYLLNLNTYLLRVSGGVTGAPMLRMTAGDLPSNLANVPTRGLLLTGPTVLAAAMRTDFGHAFPCVIADGTTVDYTGVWNAGQGSSRTYWALTNGATFTVRTTARINTNQDLINSRCISVAGFAGNNVIDHDAAFDADHMGWTPTDQSQWTNDGMSVVGVAGRVTYQTRHSRNLPTVHKKVPIYNAAGVQTQVHDHHGILGFGISTGRIAPPVSDLRWIVRDNAQDFDGLVQVFANLTINAQTDLTCSGVFGKAGSGTLPNGTKWAEPKTSFTISPSVTLTKTGPAALIITGTQGYAANATLRVVAGAARFVSDPARDFQTTFGVAFPYPALGTTGNHLRVSVEGAGEARFAPAFGDDHGIYRVAATAGTVAIGAGSLAIAQDLVLAGAPALTLALGAADDGRSKIAVAGNVQIDGTLTVTGADLTAASYVLIASAGTIAGAFDAVTVPEGWQLQTTATSISLVPVEGTGSVAMHRVAR